MLPFPLTDVCVCASSVHVLPAPFLTLSPMVRGSVRLRLVKQAAHAQWHFLNVAQLEVYSLARLSGTHTLLAQEGGARDNDGDVHA